MTRNRKILYISMGITCIVFIICCCYFKFSDMDQENFEEIKKGNFSVIENADERERDSLRIIYQNRNRKELEWIFYDLNHDGKKELIWREKGTPSKYMRSIVAIFGEEQGNVKLILLDTEDVTEFYALQNGNLIYYWQRFWLYSYSSYTKCFMNENYEIEAEEELEIYVIPSYEFLLQEAGKEWVETLLKEYPFIEGEGNYYRLIYKQGEQKVEMLTEEEGMNKLKSFLGVSLKKVNFDLYEQLNNVQ